MALTLPTVQTDLNFYKALDDEKPYIYTYEHDPQTNFSQDTKPAVIHDIRGHEDEFTLDKNGFQIYQHESAEKDFTDDEKIKTEYYREVEDLLKAATGAHKVVI